MMKHKDESFEKFKTFKNEVQNQLGKSIKALQMDRDGEYLSQTNLVKVLKLFERIEVVNT